MNRSVTPGQGFFAVGMACLGLLSILYGDFIVGRPPAWPAALHLTPAIGYVAGTITLSAALVVIFFFRSAGPASLIIAVLILVLSVFRHISGFMNDWLNSLKALALFGGALIVGSSFFNAYYILFAKVRVNIKTRRAFILLGSVLLGIFLIGAGYAHFKFADVVKDFIPAYIPFHVFWTYFTGVCLLAGGVGLIIPYTRTWAALLSGIMVMGWFLLLHIPRFLANTQDVGDRLGLCESLTFAGIFFVLFANAKK